MVSLIQCCLVSMCMVVFIVMVLVSLGLSAYVYRVGDYAYQHGGHVDPLSLVTKGPEFYQYNFLLSLEITAIWVVALCAFVCLAYAVCVMVKVESTKLARCLCPCCNSRPARASLSNDILDEY